MKSFSTHLAVGAAALISGGLVAAEVIKPTDPAKPVADRVAVAPPEQVRTQTVTRVIHRVHRVHLHPKARPVATPPAPAPAPAPVPAPAVVPRRVQVAAPIPVSHSAPAATTKPTLTSRTSGHGTGSSGSRRGEDDGHEHDNHEYEGGDD